MKDITKYNPLLVENRKMLEASFVFCLWKNPELFLDYSEFNPSTELITDDAKFYYSIGSEIHSLGYKSLDNASVYGYLKDSEEIRNKFNTMGGFKTVDKMCKILSLDNVESYYDGLTKSNMILTLDDKGFNVLDQFDTFKKMTTSELYDFYEYQLDTIFLGRGSGVKIEDLEITDDFINRSNSGENRGLSYASTAPLMNYHTMGLHKSNVQIFGGFSGTGKAQDLSSKIMTPNGYIEMRNAKVGDEIFGEDGKIHHITGVFPQGKKDMYEVIFSDDSKTITCDEHLWNVQNPTMRTKGEFKTLTLREIIDKGLYKNYKGNEHKTWMNYIPMTKPLEFGGNSELSIPPYLLGVLIGDGTLNSCSIMVTVNDQEKDLVEYINDYCINNNLKLNINKEDDTGCTTYRFAKGGGKTNHLKEKLTKLSLYPTVSNSKFIPKEYLFATVQERIDLLSGLIDTDGEVNNANYNYSTVSSQLANDVQFLVQSLGGTAKIETRQTRYTYDGEKKDGQVSYRLFIKMPREIQAFKSVKHKNKYKEGQTCARRTIREVKDIGKREAQCISTSNPNKLYLTDDMIVTHNTSYVMNSYVMPILDAGESIVIVANEMNIDAWRHMYLATILSQKLKYFGLTRKKQKAGGYTDEQLLKIKEAQAYAKAHYKDRIKFVKVYDYSMEDVKRVFRKMSKRGFSYGLLDTFKAGNNASDNVTGELIESSKQLLQVAEKENMCIIITMQLAIHMENTRYLTGATLSNAKGVKEVVSELVLMRKLWDDEFNGCKYDVKPWKYIKDSDTGKITGSKEYITLDPEKRYRLMFLDKTRNDEDDICILSRFDGNWNHWKEIGYCTPSHQNR